MKPNLVPKLQFGNESWVSSGACEAPLHKWLIPGEIYELDIPLKVVSWVFKPGHRLRVSISSSDWPTIWPSPQPATNEIFRGRVHPSRIILPVVGPTESGLPEPRFLPPPELRQTAKIHGDKPTWRVSHDLIEGYTTINLRDHGITQPEGESFSLEEDCRIELAASDENPANAYAKGSQHYRIVRPDSQTDVVGRAAIRSTTEHFHVDIELNVAIDNEPFFNRCWLETIPRNFV